MFLWFSPHGNIIGQTQENPWISQLQQCAVHVCTIPCALVSATPQFDVDASFTVCLILHRSKIISPFFVNFVNLSLGTPHLPFRVKFFCTSNFPSVSLEWNSFTLIFPTGYNSAQVTLTSSHFVLLLGGPTTTIIFNIGSFTPVYLTFRELIQ